MGARRRSSNQSDPFADPSANADRVDLDAGSILYVGRNARLSLDPESLVVDDTALRYRPSYDCFGLLSRNSPTTQAISYRNILNASLSDLELSIVHALPTSKRAVRPAHITYTLSNKDAANSAKPWIAKLLAKAYGTSQRRKRIKVLINPFGGQGAASRIYYREVEPIFSAAGCELDIQETTRSGHAVEIAKDLDVDRYDVVACCSGDGLPHEVFNGLAKQRRPRRALRCIAVTQIPCGSGNAMSLNLNGTDSPSLAAVAVVKGIRSPMDLVVITQGTARYLSFLSQAVGIVAESDLGTENIRWMGSARFTVGFLTRLLGKTVYPAHLAVKVEACDKLAVRASYARTRAAREAISAKRPDDSLDDSPPPPSDEDEFLPQLQYGTIDSPIPSDWESTDMPTLGNFYCGNMTWMSPDAPFFAAALPNDSALDLVNIDGQIPRMSAVKLLLSVEENRLFDQPMVSYRKIKAYRITPRLREGQKEGFISVDGEKVPFLPFQAEVVGGLGTVLSCRGAVYEFEGPRDIEA